MKKEAFAGMQEKQFLAENGTVTYWINDCGKSDTLIFLHGLTADHTLFEKQIPYFLGRYNLFCWDAPAHGKSRPYRDFDYFNAASALRSILKKEGIGKAVFIGQSMGGYIAQEYIKRYPGDVKGFVGIDTCPFGSSYYSKFDLWILGQMEWMCMCYPHKMLIKAVAKNCSYTREACENMLEALKPYTKKELCHLTGIGYAGFLKANCDLEISCPTLLIVGEHDKTGKVKQYCHAWHQKTGFPLIVIPKAAHNSNFDNSDAVNQRIEEFLQRGEA